MIRNLAALPVLLSALSVVVVGGIAWPYTVDDAYIVARYGERLAEGRGYTINEKTGPTDGVTGPLWLLPAVIAKFLWLDPVFTLKVTGLLSMTFSVWFITAWVRSRAFGRVNSLLATAVSASQSTLGIWAVAGLETGAATLAFTVAVISATYRPKPLTVLAGIAVSCLLWLRPEMAVAGGIVLGWATLRDIRRGLIGMFIAAVAAAGIIGFRFFMFGTLIPLAFFAKPAPIANGIQYVFHSIFIITGFVGAWFAWLGATKNRDSELAIGLAVSAHLLTVMIVGGDWMPGFRLIAPILPCYIILVSKGIYRLKRLRIPFYWMIASLILTCIIPCTNMAIQLPEVRSAGVNRQRIGKEFAEWLAKHVRTVALVDIGYLGYESKVEVIDLGGITDPVVAGFPGGHLSKRIDITYIKSRNPDAIVLHTSRVPHLSHDGKLLKLYGFPVEQRLANHRWIQENFRVVRIVKYNESYFYVVLTSR